MITNFKLFTETVEIAPNNTSGNAGDTSSTRNMSGYLQSGNDGNPGIQFTPKGEDDTNKSYKYKRIKKKVFKKNKKHKDEEDKKV